MRKGVDVRSLVALCRKDERAAHLIEDGGKMHTMVAIFRSYACHIEFKLLSGGLQALPTFLPPDLNPRWLMTGNSLRSILTSYLHVLVTKVFMAFIGYT